MTTNIALPTVLYGNDEYDWEHGHQCHNCFVAVCDLCSGSRTCLCSCNGTQRNVLFMEEDWNE